MIFGVGIPLAWHVMLTRVYESTVMSLPTGTSTFVLLERGIVSREDFLIIGSVGSARSQNVKTLSQELKFLSLLTRPRYQTLAQHVSLFKIRYNNLCIRARHMKSSASESKPIQSRTKVKIPGWARWEEQLSRSKSK